MEQMVNVFHKKSSWRWAQGPEQQLPCLALWQPVGPEAAGGGGVPPFKPLKTCGGCFFFFGFEHLSGWVGVIPE